MPIKKAIFCVAGFGTRFLPATKAQPKEMLPIVDKPIIQYLVEEAVAAGIEEIIFVTGRGKNSIENHFDKSFELETSLVEKGKHKMVEEVDRISKLANFAYVRQPIQKGDGHALLCAKPFIDPNESVMVIFPDYIMPSSNQTLKKMVEIYDKYQRPVIGADYVPEAKTHLYGVIDYDKTDSEKVIKVRGFVEKPAQGTAPSNLINAGYYIITPEVMQELQASSDGSNSASDGEIRVADAIVVMTKKGGEIFALIPDKAGYDCGDKIGFLKATVDIALEREDLKEEFMEFLKSRVS
jgi:UTP--glucose-1-phosphate uridylyltransferase